MEVGFKTQRERTLDAYEQAGEQFRATTQPYHSTRALVARGADMNENDGFGFLVYEAQTLRFFDYGVGDNIAFGADVAGGATIRATEAETNLAKAKSTNGAVDFVIEGVGLHCRGYRVTFPTNGQANFGDGGAPTDPDVLSALAGSLPMVDPGSIAMPAQVQSPFNLEHPMFQGLLGYLSLEFEFDRTRIEKLGVCDLLPQAGAQSYLRANGVPASHNRYCIDEGYLWRRDGEPDSEFVANVSLERDIVVPVNLPTDPDAGFSGFGDMQPSNVSTEVVMRLYGLAVGLPSSN